MMRYGSVCSGIESCTVAWHTLGWEPAFFAETEKFPSAVLAHRFHETPNHGDFTTIEEGDYEPIELLVGGTPCQSFSVAGKRLGLDDPRGNLALEYLALARRLQPRWLVFENVPGLLSLDGGRAFAAFLQRLGECGYGYAYRVLDAQYIRVDTHPRAVPQRRRRVFVVGYLGDWRPPAAVLFEPEGLRGDPAPRREAGQGTAPTIASRPTGGGGLGTDFDCDGGLIARGYGSDGKNIARPVTTGEHQRQDWETCTMVTHSLRADGFDASEDGTGRGTPLVPQPIPLQEVNARKSKNQNGVGMGVGADGDVMYTLQSGQQHGVAVPFDTTQITSKGNYSRPKAGDPCHPLAEGGHPPAVAFSCKDHGADQGETSPTLRAMDHDGSHANAGGQVAVAFNITPSNSNKDFNAREARYSQAVTASAGLPSARGGDVVMQPAVRRLTPRECERLQGFPDDFTLIPWRKGMAPDGPRYKALGNAMAVNCMRWLGLRIELCEQAMREART